MSGRILNFSEFFDKYSKEEEKEFGDFTQSAANFEEGFDKETYTQTQLGPNKPVDSNVENTPPSPGEHNTPSFTNKKDKEMDAPDDIAAELEKEEIPQPEAGTNPEKEMKESKKFKEVVGFNQFINEQIDWGAEYVPEEGWEEENLEEYEDEELCPTCGEEIIGYSCGCNPAKYKS